MRDETPTNTAPTPQPQSSHLNFIHNVLAECGYRRSVPRNVNLSTFHWLLKIIHQSRTLVPNRRVALAVSIVSHLMDATPWKPTVQTLNLVLSAFAMKHRKGIANKPNHQEATDLFRSWQKWHSQGLVQDDVDLVSYNKLMYLLSRAAACSETEQLFREIQQRGNSDSSFHPDIVSYGCRMFAQAMAGDKRQVQRILQEMLSYGPQPNVLALNDVLQAYSISKDPQNAMEFLVWWKSSADTLVAPDIKSYNVVLRSVARSPESMVNYSNARVFFESIPVPKDSVTYSTMIGICARNLHGSFVLEETADILTAAMADQRIVLDNPLVTKVLYALAAANDEKAPQLADRLVADFCEDKANAFVYEALVHCWSKSTNSYASERALGILDSVEKGQKVKPTVKLYTNVIGALHNFPDEKAAGIIGKLLTKMETSGPPPNAVTYSASIGIIARSEMADKASIAYNILKRMKVPPTIVVYNGILNACEYAHRDPNKALENLQIACDVFMRARNDTNVQLTHITYGSFISTVGRLMEPTAQRDVVVSKIFRQCCREGQANAHVVNKMKTAMVSKETFRMVLEGHEVNDHPSS